MRELSIAGPAPQGTGFKKIGSVIEELSYLDGIVEKMFSHELEARHDSIRSIRQEINARRNEYLSHQKLSTLTNTVVPEGEIDDPLAHNPPELIDFDWNGQVLTLSLDQPVNGGWISALCNMGSHRSMVRYEPQKFQFTGASAQINVGANARIQEIQSIIDIFKEWLPKATSVYHHNLKNELEQASKREQADLVNQIRLEEQKQALRAGIKI